MILEGRGQPFKSRSLLLNRDDTGGARKKLGKKYLADFLPNNYIRDYTNFDENVINLLTLRHCLIRNEYDIQWISEM